MNDNELMTFGVGNKWHRRYHNVLYKTRCGLYIGLHLVSPNSGLKVTDQKFVPVEDQCESCNRSLVAEINRESLEVKNKRVRDAAPDLLAACKTALKSVPKNWKLYDTLARAVAKAEKVQSPCPFIPSIKCDKPVNDFCDVETCSYWVPF